VAALGALYVIWGSTYLAIKVLVGVAPALLSMSARFAVAGLVVLAVLALRRGRAAVRFAPREVAGATLIGGLLLFGGNGLVAIAERHVPSGLAALVIASEPLWVVALRALFADRPSAGVAVPVLAGFAGVALLVLPGSRPAGVAAGFVLLLLFSALCWASGSLASRRVPLPADPFASTGLQMVCGAVLLAVGGALGGELGAVHLDRLTAGGVAAFAYLVLFGSLLAFTAYVWLLRNVPIQRVSTYAYVNPLVAVALGAAILGEAVSAPMLLAAGIIVGSVALIVRRT
jgi:drug/metabolite transporter (DMT)-like permease